jgi:Kef-type K+ transport system membrane component KefB
MPRSNRLAVTLGYSVVLVVAVAIFVWIRSIGERLGGATVLRQSQAALDAGPTINTVSHVLLALAVIIVTARAMGEVFGWFGQPAVIGEVVGGIMLGPSVLGRIAPGVLAGVLPPAVAPFLGVHAQIGIMLYMFLVGLELDLGVLRKSGHATIAISHASIIVPFLLGSALALVLYPRLSSSDVPFTVFALFIGVSLSITAFPVLARILTDRGIQKTRMGTLALACAAVDDVTAWCLLALVVSIAHAHGSQAILTAALTIAFITLMFVVARPLVRRWLPLLEGQGKISRTGLSTMFAAMLASAMATESIGIHGIFGAFMFGAIVPHDSRVATDLNDRLEDVVAILFLPAFFAFTGMRTQVALIRGLGDWLLCGAITLVACAGKFGGTVVAGRLTGLRWRDSAALGVLMNTRGLVELIVLNIGLDLGVISPRLFTMLVVMALVTTFMTTPILQRIVRGHPWTA